MYKRTRTFIRPLNKPYLQTATANCKVLKMGDVFINLYISDCSFGDDYLHNFAQIG